MASPKVVFLTGLKEELIDEVISYSPTDYQIVVLDKSSTEQQQTVNDDIKHGTENENKNEVNESFPTLSAVHHR